MPLYTSSSAGSLDATAAHFQPEGAAAAGSNGTGSDSGHVHPANAWQSLLVAPAGALAETFPRMLAGTSTSISSGIVNCTGIALPKGLVVTNFTTVTTGTAEATATHGWVALLDSTGKVLAVSADQTGATWAPGGSAITVALGSAFTVATGGLYYFAISVTASTMPTLLATVSATRTDGYALSPKLFCSAGTQNAPPAVNATLTLGGANAQGHYAYVT